MKIDKATILSSCGLSIIHFVLVLVLVKRPDFLSSGTLGSICDTLESVLTQPGVWAADVMGCSYNGPMWWIFLVINSLLWGNVIAFLITKIFGGKLGGSSK